MRTQGRAGRGSDPTEREDQGNVDGRRQDNDSTAAESRATECFDQLTRAEQASAICKLVDDGMSEYTAAAATGLAVEQIRRILAERAAR